jgi:hypothetical protein
MIGLLLLITDVSGQSDSIKVTVTGIGLKGERFRVYANHCLVLDFPSSHLFRYTFSIPVDSSWRFESEVPIQIGRKGRFCFRYKNTGLGILYEPDHQRLIIIRDLRLKKRYSFLYKWSNRMI